MPIANTYRLTVIPETDDYNVEILLGTYIKGDKGDEPVLTADPDGTIYSDEKVLTEVIKDAKAQADTDHRTAGEDHTTAGDDHRTAGEDHTTAGDDHRTATEDHGRADTDHQNAQADHQTWAGYRIVVNSIGAAAPANPSSGDRWYKTTDNKVYTYTNDWDSGVAATVGATVVNSTTNDIYTFDGIKLTAIDEITAAATIGEKWLDLVSFYAGTAKANYKINNDGTIASGTNSQRVTYTTRVVRKGSILKAFFSGSTTTPIRIGITTEPITDENLTQTTLTMLCSKTLSDSSGNRYVILPFDGYVAYYATTTLVSVAVFNADVLQDNSVLDVSELNGGTAYASLGDALAAIPTSLRKGGMSIRYIDSGENKYVLYSLRVPSFSLAEFATASNWQKIDDSALQVPLYNGVRFSTGANLSLTPIQDASYSAIVLKVYAGDKFYIRGTGGSDTTKRIYATYTENGVRVRLGENAIDGRIGEIEITDNEKYLVLNLRNSYEQLIIYLTAPVPSRQLYENIVAIDGINSSLDAVTGRVSTLETSMTSVTGRVEDIEQSLNAPTEVALTGTKTEGRFLRFKEDDNTIFLNITSVANSVYTVDISQLSFGQILIGAASIKSTGNNPNKLLWAITDAYGSVLRKSDVYPINKAASVTDVNVPLDSGAKWLYVSYDNRDSELDASNIYTPLDELESIDDIKTDINTIQDDIDAKIGSVVNIESRGVQIYNRERYDNGRYTYTNRSYLSSYNENNAEDYQLPKPARINFPATENTVTVEVATHPNYDNKRSYSVSGASGSYDIYNLLPELTYYWRVINGGTTVASGTFRTEGKTRWLKIGADSGNSDLGYIDNVRDIGGFAAHDNTQIRYGRVIRGHALNGDSSPYTNIISNDGIAEMLALGIDAELDLRGNYAGASPLGQNIPYAGYPVSMLLTLINIYSNVAYYLPKYCNAIRKLIEWLGAGKQVYVHCTGGCDRTGAFAFLVEGLCGVSENDIAHDYELSLGRERGLEHGAYLQDDIYDDESKDAGFKYSMMFIKGLRKYNNTIYTKCQSYVNSNIIVGGVQYNRDGTVTDNDVKYCKWLSAQDDVLYTIDIYPTAESTLYDSTFAESAAAITELNDTYWFEVINNTTSDAAITPTPITDTSIINALDGMATPSLRDRFRLLMTLGGSAGLTYAEMDKLEELLCS